jgi:hypothetical protein
MKIKRKEIILLIFLIFLVLLVNYSYIDEKLEDFLFDYEIVIVERVIDGDTFVSGNNSIRLLGINSPERGENYYDEAKEFLEKEILNKTVRLEFAGERYDKYKRILAYVYFNEKNVNVNLVEQGFANYYFYSGKDIYSDDLTAAWDLCIKNNVNLCEKSKDICGECISISRKKILNECTFECNIEGWEIKTEGRNKFVFEEKTFFPGQEIEFELDLANSGDSLFLRDKEGKLVLWESY